MSKDTIQLGHSVEKHDHHDSTHHHQEESEIDSEESRRIVRDFQTESLSAGEQIILAIIGGGMFVGVLALIIFLIFG